jgi:hypothetical protein
MDTRNNAKYINQGIISQYQLDRVAIDQSGRTISLDELREKAECIGEERSPQEIFLTALEQGPWFRR